MMVSRNQRAFTLIELLIVLAIIGVLASIVLVATHGVRGKANAARCLNNLRQIAAALNSYGADNGGLWPAPIPASLAPGPMDTNKKWNCTALASYTGLEPSQAAWSEPFSSAVTVGKSVFRCPGHSINGKDPSPGQAPNPWRMGYAYNGNLPGPYEAPGSANQKRQVSINPLLITQPSRTMVMLDLSTDIIDGSYGNAFAGIEQTAKARHAGAVNVLFADGSSRPVKPEDLPRTWNAFGKPANATAEERNIFWLGRPDS